MLTASLVWLELGARMLVATTTTTSSGTGSSLIRTDQHTGGMCVEVTTKMNDVHTLVVSWGFGLYLLLMLGAVVALLAHTLVTQRRQEQLAMQRVVQEALVPQLGSSEEEAGRDS